MPRKSTPVVAYPEHLQHCPQCGIWFAPNPKLKRDAIYCSASCVNAAYGQRSGRRPGRRQNVLALPLTQEESAK